METISYKCPTCSAALMYNPERKAWKCEYCACEFSAEELLENFKISDTQNTMDVDEYTCSSCGAKIITDKNTVSTFCVYCGNSVIIKNRLNGILMPEGIIPFRTTKEVAIKEFLKLKFKFPLAPFDFASRDQVKNIMPVYIPFWLLDCNANGSIQATVSETVYGNYAHRVDDKVLSVTSKKYRYNAICKGGIKFANVPVDASIMYNDNVMDSIEPFDFSELKKFEPAYLSGFFAEKYDVGKKIVIKRCKKRLKKFFEACLRDKAYQRYEPISFSELNMSLRIKKVKYVLLPVWLVNIEYKGMKELFALNGQTGKIVGKVPISWFKAIIWFVFLALVILAWTMLINSFSLLIR